MNVDNIVHPPDLPFHQAVLVAVGVLATLLMLVTVSLIISFQTPYTGEQKLAPTKCKNESPIKSCCASSNSGRNANARHILIESSYARRTN